LRVFYTGISRAEDGLVQRIGWADSNDGVIFRRSCSEPLEADARWYEKKETDASGAEHWRDPFVFEHDGRWHMLITARARGAENYRAGVIGHAVSDDLDHWRIGPPLTSPSVFGQLEVSQSRSVDGHHLLIFSCGDDMKAEPGPGGGWVAGVGAAGGRGRWGLGTLMAPGTCAQSTSTPVSCFSCATERGFSRASRTSSMVSSSERLRTCCHGRTSSFCREMGTRGLRRRLPGQRAIGVPAQDWARP